MTPVECAYATARAMACDGSGHVFHHYVRAFGVFAERIDVHDVDVVERGHRVRLLKEAAAQHGVVAGRLVQAFDGDKTPQPPVARKEHHPHASLSDAGNGGEGVGEFARHCGDGGTGKRSLRVLGGRFHAYARYGIHQHAREYIKRRGAPVPPPSTGRDVLV